MTSVEQCFYLNVYWNGTKQEFMIERNHWNVNLFKSNVCETRLKNNSVLINRIETVHDTEQVKCNNCDLKFQIPSEMTKHVLVAHSNAIFFEWNFQSRGLQIDISQGISQVPTSGGGQDLGTTKSEGGNNR